jgi:hypothetical protein
VKLDEAASELVLRRHEREELPELLRQPRRQLDECTRSPSHITRYHGPHIVIPAPRRPVAQSIGGSPAHLSQNMRASASRASSFANISFSLARARSFRLTLGAAQDREVLQGSRGLGARRT